MRRGVTLPELLIAVVLLGLLTLIAIPRLVAVMGATALRHEASLLVTALDVARTAAMRLGTPTTLSVTEERYLVEGGVPGDSSAPWQREGPAARGVTVSGAGAPIRFGPSGIALGVANRTFTLSRGGASRRVVISRLGRITP
jgi:prepilin-type N-terminal cleavage/methylation domain-containing protein